MLELKVKTIIVTGGREYDDWNTLKSVLDLINPDLIIQGGANGADELAKKWSDLNFKSSPTYEADWNQHGKSAGPIRNRQMMSAYPDAILVAFPGGIGTADCINAAVEKNMIVLRVRA
jgi:hypothetical protein